MASDHKHAAMRELCFGDHVLLGASEAGVTGFIDATSAVGSSKLSLGFLPPNQEQPHEIRDSLFEIVPKMVSRPRSIASLSGRFTQPKNT